MAPRKRVESTEVVVPPAEGTVLPNMDLNLAVGRIITTNTSGIAEVAAKHAQLEKLPDLVAYAGTIDGNADLKAYLKTCSSLRTSLDKAHKDAKAPFWAACKALDEKLKEFKGSVEGLEAPAKKALLDYDNKQAKLAADAQAARLAELEAENAKLRQHLEKAEVIPPFEDKRLTVIVRGRESSQAARTLFGDGYDEVKTDERGVNYVLEVVLQRKEIQDV
jgi:rhodanese-related sulfurtransferase